MINGQTYSCRYCGKEVPGFNCSCEKKEGTKVWNCDERKKINSQNKEE